MDVWWKHPFSYNDLESSTWNNQCKVVVSGSRDQSIFDSVSSQYAWDTPCFAACNSHPLTLGSHDWPFRGFRGFSLYPSGAKATACARHVVKSKECCKHPMEARSFCDIGPSSIGKCCEFVIQHCYSMDSTGFVVVVVVVGKSTTKNHAQLSWKTEDSPWVAVRIISLRLWGLIENSKKNFRDTNREGPQEGPCLKKMIIP